MSGRSLIGGVDEAIFETDSDDFRFTIQTDDVAILTQQNLQLPIYTQNGFLTTTGGDGTIEVDTTLEGRVAALESEFPLDLDPITLDPQNGRVGIGSTQPTQALDVGGNVRIGGTDVLAVSPPEASLSVEQGLVTFKNGFVTLNNAEWAIGGSPAGEVETLLYMINKDGVMVTGLGASGDGSIFSQNELEIVTGDKLRIFTGTTSTSGTPSMVISETGNVGIGMTNPLHKVDVSGNIQLRNDGADVPRLRFTAPNGTTNEYQIIGNVNNTTDNGLQIRKVGGAEGITFIGDSGNVGVGTASPSEKLHVNGSILSTDLTRHFDIRQLKPSDIGGGKVSFGFGTWNNNNSSPFADVIHLNTWNDSSGGFTNALMVKKNAGFGIRQYQRLFGNTGAYSTYMDVVMNGGTDSVGIGGASPMTKLEVKAVAPQTNNQNNGIRISTTGPTGISQYRTFDMKLKSTLLNIVTYRASLDVMNDGTGTPIEAISIPLSSGNVGIGTISPSFQLHLSTDSAAKPSTNTWTVSCDARLKEDIQTADYDQCYNVLSNLDLKYFKWRDDLDGLGQSNIPDRHKLGWIAQEVEPLFPKAVETIPEMYGLSNVKTLNADQLYACMYGTIKKLMKEVEELKKMCV